MRKGHTEIICILDRSGSMESIKHDSIGGFNSFIESQKKIKGTADITMVLFDDKYEIPIECKNINDVEKLTDAVFVPRGMTALYDAIGKAINSTGERFSKMSENDRPEKVMVCIVTDGFENSSIEFNASKIKEMITHQKEKYNWEFCFLGANQDSFLTSRSLGIDASMTANFSADSKGTRCAYATMDSFSASYRTN